MLALAEAVGCAEHRSAPARLDALSPRERIRHLREAAVWSPIDTASLDLARGPADRAPGAVIECDFTLPEKQLEGRMAKFLCAIDGTLFAHAHTGFVVFDFFRFDDAADALRVQVVETGTPRPVYEIALELRRDARSDEAAVRAPAKGR